MASNLQGEQLQYLERHALSKLEELDDQMCDVQLIAESKTEHLAQLRTIMKRFFIDGDEGFGKRADLAHGISRERGASTRRSASIEKHQRVFEHDRFQTLAGGERGVVHDCGVRATDNDEFRR